jgi:SPP1 gp7 family putative phage head morphogenesis protein
MRDEYLEKGAALFGRQTKESLDDFRKAAGGKLDKLNDRAVSLIVHSSVQRVRNYAHINSLRQARVELGKIVAIIDERTSEICQHLNGKFIRVGVAAETVDRLTQLSPGDFALELYKGELGRAFASDPVAYVKDRVRDDGVIDDSLVKEGRGFPPYHPKCRTRVEGVIET